MSATDYSTRTANETGAGVQLAPSLGRRDFGRRVLPADPVMTRHDYLKPGPAATSIEIRSAPDTDYAGRPPLFDGGGGGGAGVGKLVDLLLALWRNRRWIWLTALLFLIGGVLFLALTPPSYRTSAQILVDPRSKNVVDGSVVPAGMGSSSLGADTILVDSQVELIGSQAVLEGVIRNFKLAEDSEFLTDRGPGFRRFLRNTLGAFVPGFVPEQTFDVPPESLALQNFRERNFWVTRIGNTYVIEVGVWSENAVKAASLANAVAQAYLDDQVRSASSSTRETTVSLESRIGELKKQVEIAERAVESYRAEKGLVSTPDGLVSEQQLQELNQRLVLARVRTAAADARFKQLQDAAAGRVDVAATTEALNSRTIQEQSAVLARATQRESVLREQLGSRHPDLVAAIAARKDAARALRVELKRIAENARSEFQLARTNERALQASLTALEARQVNDNGARVRLRELEREAESSRAIYETFLNRSKQSSEQETLNAETTRIISRAIPPSRAAFPKAPIILAASLGTGLMAGTMLAWLVHIFSTYRRKPPTSGMPGTLREATA